MRTSADEFANRRFGNAARKAAGALVLSALVELRDAAAPLPAAGVSTSAWADLALTGESIRGRANHDAMHYPETLEMLANVYLNAADPHDQRASPRYADLTGLPPLLMLVRTEEVFRRYPARRGQGGGAHKST